MFFKKLVQLTLTNSVAFVMQAHGAEDYNKSIEETYKLALQYRDGKDDHPKDPLKAKELFEEVIGQDPNHTFALHNLGLIAHGSESYEDAKGYFSKAAALGLKASQNNIWKMIIAQKVPSSLEERFLAICDLNNYELPISREELKFTFRLNICKNTGEMNCGGALHVKELYNSGYLSFPIIWVEQADKYDNPGTILTRFMIVGTKRIA